MKNVTPGDMLCHVGMCPTIFEVTPEDLRCFTGNCPSIFEVTPDAAKCEAVACPAIYEQEDGYLIVGKAIADVPEEVRARIGEGETVVWVPRGMVQPRGGE
jgi:hypothetical protein